MDAAISVRASLRGQHSTLRAHLNTDQNINILAEIKKVIPKNQDLSESVDTSILTSKLKAIQTRSTPETAQIAFEQLYCYLNRGILNIAKRVIKEFPDRAMADTTKLYNESKQEGVTPNEAILALALDHSQPESILKLNKQLVQFCKEHSIQYDLKNSGLDTSEIAQTFADASKLELIKTGGKTKTLSSYLDQLANGKLSKLTPEQQNKIKKVAKKKAALSSMISSGIHHHEAYLRQNLRQECILRIAKNIHNYITIDVPLDNVEENHYIEFSDSFKKNKMSFSQLLMHLTNMFGALENVPEEIKEMVLREIKSSDRSLYNFP